MARRKPTPYVLRRLESTPHRQRRGGRCPRTARSDRLSHRSQCGPGRPRV